MSRTDRIYNLISDLESILGVDNDELIELCYELDTASNIEREVEDKLTKMLAKSKAK